MESKLITSTAVSVVDTLTSLLESIHNGELTDLEIVTCLTQAKMMERALADFTKGVNPDALRALANVTDKNIYENQYATLKVTHTPSKYDYSISADWREAKDAEEQAGKRRKAIEKALLAAEDNEYVDKASGEIITHRPARLSGGDAILAVTLR